MAAGMDAVTPLGGPPPGLLADSAARANGRFEPAALDLDRIEHQIEKSLVSKVHRLIDEFPERAVEVIRAWMAEGR